MTETDNDSESKVIRYTITQLLSRREHGFQELIQKLSMKGFHIDHFLPILSQFQDANIQCDKRFAEMHLRTAISKGQGLIRYREVLKQLGVSEEYIQMALNEDSTDWYALAKKVKQKKFGAKVVTEPKAQMKQKRFLLYRGFSAEQIKHALTTEGES